MLPVSYIYRKYLLKRKKRFKFNNRYVKTLEKFSYIVFSVEVLRLNYKELLQSI